MVVVWLIVRGSGGMGRGRALGVRGKVKEGVACIMGVACGIGEVGSSATCEMDGVGGVSVVDSGGSENMGVASCIGCEGCSEDEGLIGDGAL